MIQYTGNPYVDAGVAVLELRLQKSCDQFTPDDLEAQAKEIKKEYKRRIWKSYLMLHLPNCAWTQRDLSSEKNQTYIEKVLGSYKADFPELDRRCAFCNRPGKVMADRRYVPLLTGEGAMTSGASGVPGTSICGYCVFAVHFYPFATLKVEGRPLFWWAPDPRWTRRLNAFFYRDVQRILAASSEELPKLRWPSTHLLRAARQVMEEIGGLLVPQRPALCDVIGIHATNYGPHPSFDELRIPRALLEFWSEAGTWELYREIEKEAWETNPPKSKKAKGKAKKGKVTGPAPAFPELDRRNMMYEALGEAFRSPDYREKAKKVAGRFFLRRRGQHVAPNTTALAEFFLEKVAGMEKERLDSIRDIADAIVGARDAKWIIDRLMRSGKSLYDYMPVMRAVQQKLSAEGKSISWEKFLMAFDLADENDATARDTWLVSELVLIRAFEKLAQTRAELLTELSVPEEGQSTLQTASGG